MRLYNAIYEDTCAKSHKLLASIDDASRKKYFDLYRLFVFCREIDEDVDLGDHPCYYTGYGL